MVKRSWFLALAVSAIAASSVSAAGSINLLLSDNATYAADVRNGTLTVGTRESGDSIVANWTVDSGGWNNTWVSLIASLKVSLKDADSIKVLFRNNDASGYSLRLTNRDGTVYQSSLYLNALGGLSAAAFKVDSANFPQQWATGGTFSPDSIAAISFVNNTNPTVLTAAGKSGVFTIIGFSVTTTGSTAVSPVAGHVSGANRIALNQNGLTFPRAGAFSVQVFNARGSLISSNRSLFSAGLNRVDFGRFGSGLFIVHVRGEVLSSTNRLIIRK